MDKLLEQLEAEISSLVDKISHYQPIEECSKRIFQLDDDAVAALEELRQHYSACKRLEVLKLESSQLDKKINETLVGLSDCRKLLELTSTGDESTDPVAADVLLNYATKITRFTKRLPGVEVLPWPTEDQIRKGMLATLAIQRQDQAAENAMADMQIALEEEEPMAVDIERSEEPQETQDLQEQQERSRPTRSSRQGEAATRAAKPVINLDLDSDSD